MSAHPPLTPTYTTSAISASSLTPTSQTTHAIHFDGQQCQTTTLTLIEEVPVSLEYDHQAAIVLIACPQDLAALALGFSLTEGIIIHPNQLLELDIVPTQHGMGILMRLAPGLWQAAQARQRHQAAASSCSLCGVHDMLQAMAVPPFLPIDQRFMASAISRALQALPQQQILSAQTGCAHAAAFISATGELVEIAEDSGRHNALDKLVGKLAQRTIHPANGFCVITSRASFEMVQKAARAGFPMLCAISAPTAMAQRMAEAAGMTLCSFVREQRFTCLSHPERIIFS